jgi:hypothetical protein
VLRSPRAEEPYAHAEPGQSEQAVEEWLGDSPLLGSLALLPHVRIIANQPTCGNRGAG